MKSGDLVKCRDDENYLFGMGLVVKEETRMVKVLWLSGFADDGFGRIDDPADWNWKCNLELAK
jgi:hypothetical protein